MDNSWKGTKTICIKMENKNTLDYIKIINFFKQNIIINRVLSIHRIGENSYDMCKLNR